MGKRKRTHGYRHGNQPMKNRIRVRGKRLTDIDDTKLTLAYWLLAKRIVEDKTDPGELNEEEVRRIADGLEDDATGAKGRA